MTWAASGGGGGAINLENNDAALTGTPHSTVDFKLPLLATNESGGEARLELTKTGSGTTAVVETTGAPADGCAQYASGNLTSIAAACLTATGTANGRVPYLTGTTTFGASGNWTNDDATSTVTHLRDSTTAANASSEQFNRTRSGGAVSANDLLGSVIFQGHDGTAQGMGATITAFALAAYTGSNHQSELDLSTAGSLSTAMIDRLRIRDDYLAARPAIVYLNNEQAAGGAAIRRNVLGTNGRIHAQNSAGRHFPVPLLTISGALEDNPTFTDYMPPHATLSAAMAQADTTWRAPDIRVLGAFCGVRVAPDTGSGVQSIVFTLLDDGVALSPSIACTISETSTTCGDFEQSGPAVARGSLLTWELTGTNSPTSSPTHCTLAFAFDGTDSNTNYW